MRIFHVSDCYAPRVGGVEALVRDLARQQASAGHQVHVLTVEQDVDRSSKREDDEGVTVHRLGLPLPFQAPINPAAVFRAQSLLGEYRPDVVHAHAGTLSPLSLGVTRLALGRGIPAAVTWHSMLDRSYRMQIPMMVAGGWRRAPVAWSAVSRVAAEPIERMVHADVAVIANGISLEKWSPASEPPDPSLPLRGVATMRLIPRKRTVALVEIIAQAMDDLPPGSIKFDFFGSGPEQWRIQQHIEAKRVGEAITMHGKVDRDQLLDHYRNSHVFATAAGREAFGIAALEGRTAGLVLLARRGTGVEEFVTHGVDSLLSSSDREMSEHLVRLATRPSLLEQLQQQARSDVPPFGFDHLLKRVFQEYSRAEALRSTSPVLV